MIGPNRVEPPEQEQREMRHGHMMGHVRVDTLTLASHVAYLEGREPIRARQLLVSTNRDGLNVAVSLFHELREWPPGHIGDKAAGITLNREEAEQLRAAISDWLAAGTGEAS